MVIRDCNKNNKWSWLYIMLNKYYPEIHFNGTIEYVFDENIINFIKR